MNLFDLTNGLNGFEIAFLQSEEYGDQIVRLFKSNYEDGDDPNDLVNQIANGLNISDGDLFPDTKKRIENEIKNYLMRY